MAATLSELLIEVQDLVEKLESIGFGSDTESVTYNLVTRPTLQKSIADKFAALQAMVQSHRTFETKSLLDASGAPTADSNGDFPLSEVWKDVPGSNGLYGWDGSAWVLSVYYRTTDVIDPSNTTDAVTGVGVHPLKEEVSPVSNLVSDFYGGYVKQADVVQNDGVATVNDSGDISMSVNTFPYPWLVFNKDETNTVEFNRVGLEYCLIATGPSSSIIMTITGGGIGRMYRVDQAGAFTDLGLIPSYDTAVDVTYMRLSLIKGVFKIEGKATKDASYSVVVSYDYTANVQVEYLAGKNIGMVRKSADLMARSVTRGNPVEGNWNDKSWALIGDSITAANTYPPLIQTKLNIDSYQNLAVSGTTIVNQGATPMVTEYLNITGSPELITVFGGTNDFGKSLALGTEASILDTDFYGALKILAAGLVAAHPTARIFFTTILHRDWQGGGQAAGLVNENGNSVQDFNDAIKYVAALNSIPVIDLYSDAGISVGNIGTYTSDRLHPNTLGTARVANVMSAAIDGFEY